MSMADVDQILRDMKLSDSVETALHILFNDGQTDGSHHKTWVIDQAVRALLKYEEDGVYEALVRAYEDGEEGRHTYEWNEGLAP